MSEGTFASERAVPEMGCVVKLLIETLPNLYLALGGGFDRFNPPNSNDQLRGNLYAGISFFLGPLALISGYDWRREAVFGLAIVIR
jgi:hypothetical protein